MTILSGLDTPDGLDFVIVNRPPVAQCQDRTIFTDTGLCTATISVDNASFDPDGDPITLDQVPPGPYSLGDNTVTLTVTDDSGASDFCTAVVTVEDRELPAISCVESHNPSGKNVPKAGKVNEDGFYQVSAGDNCTVPEITLGSFTLAEGETIKLTQTPGKSGVKLVNTMGKGEIRHFQVGPGDAVIMATDGAGNVCGGDLPGSAATEVRPVRGEIGQDHPLELRAGILAKVPALIYIGRRLPGRRRRPVPATERTASGDGRRGSPVTTHWADEYAGWSATANDSSSTLASAGRARWREREVCQGCRGRRRDRGSASLHAA